jgi:hypothetical protein
MPGQTQKLLLQTVTELTTTYPGFTVPNPSLEAKPATELLARLQHLLQETSEQISGKYFDEVKAHHQLVCTDWDDEL